MQRPSRKRRVCVHERNPRALRTFLSAIGTKNDDAFIRLATRPFNKVEHLLVKLSVDLLNH